MRFSIGAIRTPSAAHTIPNSHASDSNTNYSLQPPYAQLAATGSEETSSLKRRWLRTGGYGLSLRGRHLRGIVGCMNEMVLRGGQRRVIAGCMKEMWTAHTSQRRLSAIKIESRRRYDVEAESGRARVQ